MGQRSNISDLVKLLKVCALCEARDLYSSLSPSLTQCLVRRMAQQMFRGRMHGQMGPNTEVPSFSYKEDHHWRIDCLCPSLSEWHLPSPMLRQKLGCYGDNSFSFAPHNQPNFVSPTS